VIAIPIGRIKSVAIFSVKPRLERTDNLVASRTYELPAAVTSRG